MTIGALQHPAAQGTNHIQATTAVLPSRLQGVGQHHIDIHPALKEIRQLPEFQPPTPSPLDALWKHPWIKKWVNLAGQWLDGVLKSLKKLLDQTTPSLMPDLPQNIRDLFSVFITFVLILAGLYGIYLILTLLLRWQEQKRQKNSPQAPRFFEESLLINSGHHAENAAMAAQAGDYTRGVRELYMASLCLLDESGLIPYEAARSNLEYQQNLAQKTRSDLKSPFQSIANSFERTHYGRQPANALYFERSQMQFKNFQRNLQKTWNGSQPLSHD